MKITRLEKNDLSKIKELAHQIWPVAYKEMISEEQINYMLDWMYDVSALEKQCDEGHQFYIVEDKGERQGFLDVEVELNSQKLKVHKLYVLTDKHGMGYGRILLHYAFQLAKEAGLSDVYLQVNRNNPAVHFYQKQGMEIVETADFDIGNGFFMNDFIMSKKL
jgi:ribosomal protein S18 acetylase RimI-like enzyme